MLKDLVYIDTKEYGICYQGSKGNTVYVPLGRAPKLKEVFESLENDHVALKLTTKFFGRTKVAYLDLGELYDGKRVKELASLGFDATKGKGEVFLEAVRMLLNAKEDSKVIPTKTYESLGWIQIPTWDPQTKQMNLNLCYRCHDLIGSNDPSQYVGDVDIEPAGDFNVWRDLVINDVVPHPRMQLVLIASLSAVLTGALAFVSPIENGILHLCAASSAGKTTGADLATSTLGRPFEGSWSTHDKDWRAVEKRSVTMSWGATDNAMVTRQAGNRGAVTVLNELGKNLSKSLDRLLFDFSEGSDKVRLNSRLETRVSKGYSTTFISTGEASLLAKCVNKYEGLAVRVMEIKGALTVSAQHSNRIKKVCRENYGWAAPMLAEHIINHGGAEYVRDCYEYWNEYLQPHFKGTPNAARFVEKFAALYMATAEMATEALGIDFDMDGLLKFLKEYDQTEGPARNTSLESYREILEYCDTHPDEFVHQDLTSKKVSNYNGILNGPGRICYGRITYMKKVLPDGRVQTREYELYPYFVDRMLKHNNHLNRDTCIDAWINAGVLDIYDPTHVKKKRTIGRNASTPVYVLQAFADDEDAAEIIAELAEEAARQAEKQKARANSKKHVKSLLVEAEKDVMESA